MYQATSTDVAEGSVIDASAISKGDGGEVVIWSKIDDKSAVTYASGSIFSRGGLLGGNGGRIETSGGKLNISGISVDTKSISGSDGTWLIDPYDITITSTQAGVHYDQSGGSPNLIWTANADSSQISVSDILTGLFHQILPFQPVGLVLVRKTVTLQLHQHSLLQAQIL